MRLFLCVGIVVGMALSLAAAASANEIGLGARAVGMGGAFAAIADDGTAPYWNPAGITQLKAAGITPTLSLNGDFAMPDTSVGDEFPPNLGNLDLRFDGMIGVIFKGVALSLIVGADGQTIHDEGAPLSLGETSVAATGMLTLAREFGEFLAVGGNLKIFYGEELEFGANAVNGNYQAREIAGYAVDLGILLKLGEIARLGAVYENAYSAIETHYTNCTWNGASWDELASGTEDGELDGVWHLGAAFKLPVAGTLLAVQADLHCGYNTYRLGVEHSFLVAKLRGGAVMDNDFGIAWYTAGAGFKFGPVLFDVAAVADDGFELETFMITAGFAF